MEDTATNLAQGGLTSQAVQDHLDFLRKTGSIFSESKDFSEMFIAIMRRLEYASGAEGGSLYIYDETTETLKIVVMTNNPLNIEQVVEKFDPIAINGFIEVPLRRDDGEYDLGRGSVRCFCKGEIVHVDDVYHPSAEYEDMDFEPTYKFDKMNNYKTKNLAIFPLLGANQRVLGALQLVNCRPGLLDGTSKKFFDALIWQISLVLNSALLVNELEVLLTSLVGMVVKGIDEKSAHTAGHCHRVTELTMQIAEEMCDATDGPFADFNLTPAERRELRMSAMLHDVGKIVTPMHIMEKETKLYSLYDRIAAVQDRLQMWQMHQRVLKLEQAMRDNGLSDVLDKIEDEPIAEDSDFLYRLNRGEIRMDEEIAAKVDEIAHRQIGTGEGATPLIDETDRENLKIIKGTLNDEEWQIMRDHVSISIRLLQSIPWPKNLRQVVSLAGAHHESCNGTGYPHGLLEKDVTLPALILGFADRFEGMTAPDRPYRKVKMTLGRAMDIMGFMAKDGEINNDMLEFFKEKKIYMRYARKHLPDELIDCD